MILNRYWNRFLIASTVALALASLVPLFGHIAPWLELFVHFKVHYIFASIILVLAAIKMRRHGIATAALFLAGLNAATVMPSFTNTSAAAATATDTPNLKLINLNILETNPSPDSVIDFLRREHADIVVLEEVTPRWVENLKTLADVYPHMLFCDGSSRCDLSLLSKNPWQFAEVRKLSETGPHAIVAKYDLRGLSFTLLGTHLDPPTPSHRDHEHFHNEHVRKLSAILRSIDGPLIVAGDLNATQWSPSFNRIIEGTGLKRVDGGLLPTWPSQLSLIGIPIDQILTTEEFKGSTMMVGPQVNSDHLPLIANLRIKG